MIADLIKQQHEHEKLEKKVHGEDFKFCLALNWK